MLFRRCALICGLVSSALAVAAVTVNLAWNASPDLDVVSYTMYQATNGADGTFKSIGVIYGRTNCFFSVTNLSSGNYWWCVTASNDFLESLPSNILPWTVKPTPPTIIKAGHHP